MHQQKSTHYEKTVLKNVLLKVKPVLIVVFITGNMVKYLKVDVFHLFLHYFPYLLCSNEKQVRE